MDIKQPGKLSKPAAQPATTDKPEGENAKVNETTAATAAPAPEEEVVEEVKEAAKPVEEPARRTDTAPKLSRPHVEPNAAAAIEAAADDYEASAEQVQFISSFPDLTLYIDIGEKMQDQAGRDVPVQTQVKFKNGVYAHDDPRIILALRSHPNYNTQYFREAATAHSAAVLQAAAAKRRQLQQATTAGPSASGDGSDAAFLQQQRDMDALEQKILGGAG